MLSLLGSLQQDPFSPLHQPLPASSTLPSKRNKRKSAVSLAEEESIEDILTQKEEAEVPEVPFSREARDSGAEFDEADEDLDERIDPDHPFAALGKETDELFRETKEKKRTKEKENRKEKKQEKEKGKEIEATGSKKRKKEDKEARRKRRREEKLANASASTNDNTNFDHESLQMIEDMPEEPKRKKKKKKADEDS